MLGMKNNPVEELKIKQSVTPNKLKTPLYPAKQDIDEIKQALVQVLENQRVIYGMLQPKPEDSLTAEEKSLVPKDKIEQYLKLKAEDPGFAETMLDGYKAKKK